MAVRIGGLRSRSTTYDLSGHQLRTAYGVHSLTLDERVYVYVTGLNDDGVSVFELTADGSLINIQNIDDGPSSTSPRQLLGASAITSVAMGDETYLYVAGSLDDGINVFRVAADGQLSSVQYVTDDPTLELNGIEGRMAVATVAGTTYLVATGDDDNGISIFRVEADGTLTNTDNVTDAGALELDNAMDAVTAVVGGKTFVVVAGEDDNGLSVFELRADGTVVNTFNVTDDGTLNLWGAMGLAVAKVEGSTYVVASGGYDDGLSVFRMTASGTLANVFNVEDTPALGLDGAQGLSTFTLDTETFVAVSGRDDDALSVFHIGADGVLTEVTSVFDDALVALNGTYYNGFATLNGVPYLVATGYPDDGVSVLEIGGRADSLTGTAADDLLLGLGGDDVLRGGAGNDRILGGTGDDEAVYKGRRSDYSIVVNESGSLTVRDLRVGSPDGTDRLGSVEWLRFSDKRIASDRLLSDLVGSNRNDRLTGTAEADALWGRGGDDTLSGLGAADRLRGDGGRDTLDGGGGGDWLHGGAGADAARYGSAVRVALDGTVVATGQAWGDTFVSVENLIGSAAADRLRGDAGANALRGQGGNDLIEGRGGSDALSGGGGSDALRGGMGADILKGGKGADLLSGGGGEDRYVFRGAGESAPGARDRIEGFAPGDDRIVLTGIDANRLVAGNQGFELDAGGGFSAGEIRQSVTANGIRLTLNLDRDQDPEMSILLIGLGSALGAGDFEF